ncbi:hypothetical protein [Roseivivax isoporae]|uniref:Flagellar assembly protein FliH/Type III secretion system HrpE domain-containing protein n=1 Tax=Roseivivax isoporae LMG 25204 TaxID=1449351 RepID=X7F9W9_9RHOB|nr:hypothetical protein [Roseivivax isoporae]ETX28906.1 hypothetical protein RISW2_04125 [Roseivivax isoporae LMG 25204]
MRFVFDRDFDREIEIERGGVGIAAEDAAEDEILGRIEAARREGFEDGRVEGHRIAMAEAHAEMQRLRLSALGTLAAGMQDLVAATDLHRAQLEADAADFAFALCEKFAPEILGRLGPGRLRTEVLAALKLTLGAGRVRVRLSSDSAERLGPGIEAEAEALGLDARIEIIRDDTLGPGDGRVEWNNGFMETHFASLCDRVIATLREAKETGVRPAPGRSIADE